MQTVEAGEAFGGKRERAGGFFPVLDGLGGNAGGAGKLGARHVEIFAQPGDASWSWFERTVFFRRSLFRWGGYCGSARSGELGFGCGLKFDAENVFQCLAGESAAAVAAGTTGGDLRGGCIGIDELLVIDTTEEKQ